MGTVLSFSPRERRPIYSTHHHGNGTRSNSSSEFQLNNYAYEQINNAKNRENSKPMQYLTVPNQFQIQNGNNVLFGSSNSNIMNNNVPSNTIVIDEREADSARILSEKNAIEKNLKKHSLFINALSWKRLSSSHGKKKMESNNVKNKTGITTSTFRPPALTDTVHPMVVVNDKKKYQHQQIQLVSSNSSKNIIVNNQQPIQQPLQNQTIFYTPKSLLALDLERAANNTNNLHHHHNVDKVGSKTSVPLRTVQLTQQTSKIELQQQQPAPRKTIIQVS